MFIIKENNTILLKVEYKGNSSVVCVSNKKKYNL